MTNEQTTEIILRKRTQSMQSDSCTLSGQERVSLSLLALPKYMHLSDTSSYSEILQKINDGITCQKNRMEGYYNLCACQILEMMILVSRQFVTSLAQEKTGVILLQTTSSPSGISLDDNFLIQQSIDIHT